MASAEALRTPAWSPFRYLLLTLMATLFKSQNSKKKSTGESLLLVMDASLPTVQYFPVESANENRKREGERTLGFAEAPPAWPLDGSVRRNGSGP